METGVGRLLTAEERRLWPKGKLRSAFVIDGCYVITAWHCLSGIGGTSAKVWLRLQSDIETTGFIDVPLIYEGHTENLDVALLAVDERQLSIDGQSLPLQRLRSLLESVALPLGADIKAHDLVRVGGFPETNPSNFCVMLTGKVDSTNAKIGISRAIRLHVDGLAARYAENPRGMSGGPVLRRRSDGSEDVVGILSAFPPSVGGQGALGGEILARHLADLSSLFPAVREALLRTRAKSPTSDARRVSENGAPTLLELSRDVQDLYRPALRSAPATTMPIRWDYDELVQLLSEVESCRQGPSKVANTLKALCEGLRAKRVFQEIGGSAIELGHLQVLYRQEIGRWPEGNSADALLVEAADVDLAQRRRASLGALALFMVGVAARLGKAPESCSQLSSWIGSLNHQVADAQQHYKLRQESAAWLLIDLGDEPGTRTTIWPTVVAWTRSADDGTMTGTVPCEGTEEGVYRALREILRIVPPARPLLVDFAVPYPLMNKGIEQWPILELDGEFTTLGQESRPRLRWSRRRRDLVLHNRLLEWTAKVSWDMDAADLPDELHIDYQKLKQWIRADLRACLVGGPSRATGADPLRIILREGCGFVIWLSPDHRNTHRHQICAAIQQVPPPARRRKLPDELPDFAGQYPAIIWDDPNGREGFDLPPLVVPESF